MLLAVDIGNTNVTFAFFKDKKIIKQLDLPVNSYTAAKFIKKSGRLAKSISAALICSVVPKLTLILAQDLTRLTGKRPYIIGKQVIVPIRNLYCQPAQLGADRLVNAYAASVLYDCPIIVIDSGTAITFDLVSKNKHYLGGLIFPGLVMSLNGLKGDTALLPKVKLRPPSVFIGRNTKESILSGVVIGTAALCKELIARIKKYLGKNTLVLGTGGNINLIKRYSGLKIKIDPDLTLKGINLVYLQKIKKHI